MDEFSWTFLKTLLLIFIIIILATVNLLSSSSFCERPILSSYSIRSSFVSSIKDCHMKINMPLSAVTGVITHSRDQCCFFMKYQIFLYKTKCTGMKVSDFITEKSLIYYTVGRRSTQLQNHHYWLHFVATDKAILNWN